MSISPLNPVSESTFFSLEPCFSGSASGFKELQLGLICQKTRLPFFARPFISAQRSIQPSTRLYGFGGDKVLHITLFSTLYITLSQHTTH